MPPPSEGVWGLDACRQTWPPFFKWQEQGASFEIVSLEVTAGVEVGFAHALLRCGTPAELHEDPDNRLRLTVGLRKERGRWVVTHEHHSFPDKDCLRAKQRSRLSFGRFGDEARGRVRPENEREARDPRAT